MLIQDTSKFGNITAIRSLGITCTQGQTFYTDIETTNNTSSSATKDFLAAFGTYNESTGEFSISFGWLTLNATVGTGVHTTTVNCQATAGNGTYDGIGCFGSYNESQGVFTFEDAMVILDCLTISGGASGELTVTNVTLRK